jgi:hypothetical protein
MVTGKILEIKMSYPSVQVEVAFTDDQNRLPDPTHLIYNIPVEETNLLTQESLAERVRQDAMNFDSLLHSVDGLQENVNTEVTSV